MEHNPYAPTSSVLAGGPDALGAAIQNASRGRRLTNLLLDLVAYLLVSILIEMVNAIVNLSYGVDFVGAVGPLFNLGTLFMYYFLSEAVLGRTVGKFVTRTRVIAASGATPQLWQIFVRTLCRFVPLEAVSFLGRRRDGWHDRWSRTRVIIVQRG